MLRARAGRSRGRPWGRRSRHHSPRDGGAGGRSCRNGLVARSRPIVVDGAVTGQHDGLVGHRQDHRRPARPASAPSCRRAGRCGRSSRRTARRPTAAAAGSPRRPPRARAAGRRPSRRCARARSRCRCAGRRARAASAGSSRRTSSGAVHCSRPPNSCDVPADRYFTGSSSWSRSLGVDPRRDALGAAHRRHRERVVEVAVGEQHGDGLQAAARAAPRRAAPRRRCRGRRRRTAPPGRARRRSSWCRRPGPGTRGRARTSSREGCHRRGRAAADGAPTLPAERCRFTSGASCRQERHSDHSADRASTGRTGVASTKREKELARQRAERQAARDAAAGQRRKQRNAVLGSVVAVRPGRRRRRRRHQPARRRAGRAVRLRRGRRRDRDDAERTAPRRPPPPSAAPSAAPRRRRRRPGRRRPRLHATRRPPSRPPARCCCRRPRASRPTNVYAVTLATDRGDIVFEMDSADDALHRQQPALAGPLPLLRRHRRATA